MSQSDTESTIRVDVGLLDRLMNLVGELVLARNQVLQFTSRREESALTATSQRLNLITTRLQEGVMKTRMQPIGVVWNKLPRLVRDVATSHGKQIAVDMDGAETELDKSIIEAIKEPLAHVVRNCCEHGIEPSAVRTERGKPPEGRIQLRAFHEGGQVNIEVSDDGAGIDPRQLREAAVRKGLVRAEQADRISDREALDFLFSPGFSASETRTGASRTAGLDVVKTNVERIGGVVDLASTPGQGTVVRIKIPLTLAIIPGLVVTAAGERFVIPQISLRELIRLEGDGLRQMEVVHGTSMLRRRGSLLPIVHLRALLDLDGDGQRDGLVNVVVLQSDGHEFGLVVDDVQDAQEIVVKPLDKQLKGLSVYAGATIMGDGRVALILDVPGIAALSSIFADKSQQVRGAVEQRQAAGDTSTQNYLVFQAGTFDRLAVPLALVARLEEFPRARVEKAGGQFVVQYRGQLLHLVPVGSVLDGTPFDDTNLADPVQAVVFSHRDHAMGLIVDRIVDILDDVLAATQPSTRAGLSGSAVIGKKVTDFLDLDAILPGLQRQASEPGASLNRPVVLADGSAFSRALVRNTLELAGVRVLEAGSAADAMAACQRNEVGVLLIAHDLPGGCGTLARQVRTPERRAGLRVLGFSTRADHRIRAKEREDIDDWVLGTDREGLLKAVLGSTCQDAADAAGERG